MFPNTSAAERSQIPRDAEPLRRPAWSRAVASNLLAWMALVGLLVWTYFPAMSYVVQRWVHDPDYSHGFFIPFFSLFLLWLRRDLRPRQLEVTGSAACVGVMLFLLSAAIRWLSGYWVYQTPDPLSLLPCLAGITLFVGGWQAARWAWPSIVFLFFMMPYPGAVSSLMSQPLQRVATIGSTYILQTLGLPAVARGNVIWLSGGQIGVAEACSGLSMLNVFFTLAVGAAFLVKRPLWEKGVIVLSAIGIAIISNVIRISATGIVHELVGAELADRIFHDFAGWLMMPVAILLLAAECHLLSKLLVSKASEGPVMLARR